MNETTIIDLIRHGECEGGEIFRGSTDVALSDTGWQRMQRVTESVDGWDHIVASPLQRCRRFAEWLAGERGLALDIDKRFHEMRLGDWEGVARDEIAADKPAELSGWRADPVAFAIPGAESIAEVRARVAAALVDWAGAHPGSRLLVVCHGGVIRNALAHALDMAPSATNRIHVPYACRSRLSVAGDASMRLLGHNLDDA
ncbi:MAG: histidine phosphatase family protein [Salinisphaera sp.]|jgi:alpha-ribazole phosphatase|nr:histidine phosphatase family protein [Salinisphaera sp.]